MTIPDYEFIYLVPSDSEGDWLWCEDSDPELGMEKEKSILYVRADLVIEAIGDAKTGDELINKIKKAVG